MERKGRGGAARSYEFDRADGAGEDEVEEPASDNKRPVAVEAPLSSASRVSLKPNTSRLKDRLRASKQARAVARYS